MLAQRFAFFMLGAIVATAWCLAFTVVTDPQSRIPICALPTVVLIFIVAVNIVNHWDCK